MKLISLELRDKFRSLDKGFKIDFHNLNDEGLREMNNFQPFCFAGLNGSGKSNVLEALAAIFYHLELCVAKFRPESFEKHFRRNKCNPDAFELMYLINAKLVDGKLHAKLVTISKNIDKDPVMIVEDFGNGGKQISGLSLYPPKNTNEQATVKIYLPDIVIGYSSGENEILSLPFIKNRLVHFDEYKEAVIKNLAYNEPETSLIYIDCEMSQAVLLSILLFENEDTLKPLKRELKIKGLRSFRMNLNLQKLYTDKERKNWIPILQQLNAQIDILKNCATSWFMDSEILWLDFYVDDKTKEIFRANFKNSFELFRLFQILYELNDHIVSDRIKEEVYSSKGYYTDGKLPTGSPTQNVFHFLDYLILKDVGEQEPIELLLRNLSDGEHQFLHTMGICLMLKERSSLLLLDEPETHFNPNWRAKFIDFLHDSIIAGGGSNLMKEILLTSHSPFIISDCFPNNVILFQKDAETNKTTAIKATEKGIKTYGSDINYILKNLFQTNVISSKSSNELNDIIDRGDLNELQSAIDTFGESSQKQFLFKKIYELANFDDDNEDH